MKACWRQAARDCGNIQVPGKSHIEGRSLFNITHFLFYSRKESIACASVGYAANLYSRSFLVDEISISQATSFLNYCLDGFF
jgi:hypothetical protein